MNPSRLKKVIFVIALVLRFALPAACRTETFASRIYFPGAIGVNIPSGDEQSSMRSGFSLVTAIEYRPKYTNAIFFRFNYDSLSNKYNSLASQIPTNVTQGKLTDNFFMLGLGYRHTKGKLGMYGLFQPGLNTSGYSTASSNTNGVSIGNVSTRHLAFKISTGLEYYIVPHLHWLLNPFFTICTKSTGALYLTPITSVTISALQQLYFNNQPR